MLTEVLQTGVDAVVNGHDLFGTEFSEKTQLIAHTDDGFFFALFRPLPEGRSIVVEFHPDLTRTVWVTVIVADVRSRLDGRQMVTVRVPSTLEAELPPSW
jgi:hypothetical protein